MKNLLLLLCLCIGSSVFAQTKGIIVKTHPLDYVFDASPVLDIEKQIAPGISLEVGVKWKRKTG